MLKRVQEASTGRQCPILILFAKEKDGKAFHDEKLVPTVPVNPSMDGLLDVTTSRKSGNRWDFKRFVNGFLKMVGSNSPGNVKSTSSVGVAIVEEPDDTSDNVKEQGDAIGLAEERLKRYTNSRLIVGGTPALKGFSKVEGRIKLSDARVLPVACHECGEKHALDFDNVHWIGKDGSIDVDKETGEIKQQPHEVYGFAQPDTAVYVCPNCSVEWDDYQRQKNIRETVYQAIADGDKNCGWVATKPFHGKAGFTQLPEVYSCLPGSSMADLVKDYLNAEFHAARGDETKNIKFVNQKLGKPYEFKGDQAEADQLREAALNYEQMIIPPGGFIVTAGIDVQRSPARVAVIIRAWGREQESWNLYWDELSAKVTTVDHKDPVWDSLEKLLVSPIKSAEGWSTAISAFSIDASDGHTSDAVYMFVRRMQKKYPHLVCMAVKGSSSQTDPEVFVTPKLKSIEHRNPKKATKADRFGVKVYMVGTNKAKDWLSGQMQLEVNPKATGRWHFYQGIRPDYYEQITGEVKAPHRSIPGKYTWQQKEGQPVEAWDGEVYARHAAMAKRVHLFTPAQWDDIENKLKQTDLFAVQEALAEDTETKTHQDDDLAALGQHFNG
jgi:phage terminase large subunit GpA-like protein